jgi:tetratricopeptide (TPR) repeat protein
MKKGFIYIALIAAVVAIGAFAFVKEKHRSETYMPLKERTPKLAQGADWLPLKKQAGDIYQRVIANPKDDKAKLQLASLYIQEARVTGDHLYYDRAAMQLVNGVLADDSTRFEALCFKSMLYLSEHHFADGLVYAQKAEKKNPYSSFVYGLLVDANVELGDYKEAVAMTDKMMSLRPDLRSYSRASYLREIYGDYPGSVSAMKLAVSAGYPGTEETEWTRIQLGHLYENTGDTLNARYQYEMALSERPDYAYAYAGLGRLALAGKDYKTAIEDFERADGLVEDYSFKDELIDLYALNGQTEKSKDEADKVLAKLTADAAGSAKDNTIGHYADKELAYVYIKTGDYDKAVDHALMEYNRRPDNIDVNEAVAWAYYKKGDTKNAAAYIAVALKTNSQNPQLLSRAALIYNKAGDTAKAKELMDKAMASRAYIAPDLVSEMTKTISHNA